MVTFAGVDVVDYANMQGKKEIGLEPLSLHLYLQLQMVNIPISLMLFPLSTELYIESK